RGVVRYYELFAAQKVLGCKGEKIPSVADASNAGVGPGGTNGPGGSADSPELREKRALLDPLCGGEVNLEGVGKIGAEVARTDQGGLGSCWAHAGCFELNYVLTQEAKKNGKAALDLPPCDPTLTAVATKLASETSQIWDTRDRCGQRTDNLVA